MSHVVRRILPTISRVGLKSLFRNAVLLYDHLSDISGVATEVHSIIAHNGAVQAYFGAVGCLILRLPSQFILIRPWPVHRRLPGTG